MSLAKNKLPARLLDAIDSGEEKTREEWAKHFHVPLTTIDSALNSLRKKHFMIAPIGTIRNPYTEEHIPGILKNVVLSKSDIRELTATNKKPLIRRLLNQIALAVEASKNFPELYEELETGINEIQMLMIRSKEDFKQTKNANLKLTDK